MKTLYRKALEANENIHIVNAKLKIAKTAEKIAVNNRYLPKFNSDLSYGANYGVSQRQHFENRTAGVELSGQIALFSQDLKYALRKSQAETRVAESLKNEEEQEFTYNFATEILFISQKKTRYYFAKEKQNFLDEYYAKIKEEQEVLFKEKHPDKNFVEANNATLRNIKQELSKHKRRVAEFYNEFEKEVILFEKLFLKGPIPKYLMLNPYIERYQYRVSESAEMASILANNLSVKSSDLLLESTQVDVDEAGKFRWSLNLGASASFSDVRNRGLSNNPIEGRGQIFFSIPLGGYSRKEKEKTAQLEQSIRNQTRALLINKIKTELLQTKKNIELSVNNITSLLSDYANSKKTLTMFLRPEENAEIGFEDLSLFEKRIIVETHFSDAQDLAEVQHDFLLAMLMLRKIQGRLNIDELSRIEDSHFIECKDFDDFMGLGEDFLSNFTF